MVSTRTTAEMPHSLTGVIDTTGARQSSPRTRSTHSLTASIHPDRAQSARSAGTGRTPTNSDTRSSTTAAIPSATLGSTSAHPIQPHPAGTAQPAVGGLEHDHCLASPVAQVVSVDLVDRTIDGPRREAGLTEPPPRPRHGRLAVGEFDVDGGKIHTIGQQAHAVAVGNDQVETPGRSDLHATSVPQRRVGADRTALGRLR